MDGQSRARPDLAFGAGRQGDGDAGRDHGAAAGRDLERRVSRHRGEEIEAGGVRALISRQRQVCAVRQAHDAQFRAHLLSPASSAAIRAMSMRATSSLVCGGQDSTPDGVIKWMVLPSPPMMPVAGETSLARIQSQPFLASLALALAMTWSVSAAKPMTSRGRPDLRCAIVDRISGFSISLSVGARPCCFLILLSRSARHCASRRRQLRI